MPNGPLIERSTPFKRPRDILWSLNASVAQAKDMIQHIRGTKYRSFTVSVPNTLLWQGAIWVLIFSYILRDHWIPRLPTNMVRNPPIYPVDGGHHIFAPKVQDVDALVAGTSIVAATVFWDDEP